MSLVQQNVKAIGIAVDRLNTDARRERNAILRDYYNRYEPAVRENITFIHGTQVYKDKSIDDFFRLIHKRPIQLKVVYAGGDNKALLSQAARQISDAVYRRALASEDTGKHLASLTMYMREIGRRQYTLIPRGIPTPAEIPDRAVISIVALTEYSNTLEMLTAGGILYHVAQQARRAYRGRLAVAFDYIGGQRLGGKGGSFPRIQIGFYGNERPVILRRGRKAERHFPR